LRAIDDLASELRAAGEGGRRLAVFGVSHQGGAGLSAVMLARALARDARVVLVDLALGSPDRSATATDPHAPGVAEVARGACAFGAAITRDTLSRVHLVGTGRLGAEGAAIMASERVTTMIEALSRAYDHVVIDAGAAQEAPAERIFRLARRAVLVASDAASPMTRAARERLAAAGFGDIALLHGAASASAAAA
jgi:MinD-like ATPase involved in chromosome partitioning or flagellar assembly